MSISSESRKAYEKYCAVHRRFERGDMDVGSSDVNDAYERYLEVHRRDNPEYEPYLPYSLSYVMRRHGLPSS